MKFIYLIFLLIYLFIFGHKSFGQNLVPNWSFENYDTCPNLGDQIQYAIGWSKYSLSVTSPDYYNVCSSPTAMGVPQSYSCYQPAHRNCNAYAGIITYTIAGYREHTGIQLNQTLNIGQKYFISFYAVLGEAVNAGSYYSMPSNNIGLRLSTTTFNGNNPVPIDNFAHLHSVAIISDSVNWNRISGSIIADSAYNYLIVGNFFDNANTDTLNYHCATCLNLLSYYLIDDICLSTDSLLCNGGIDEISCNVRINEMYVIDGVTIFPNPATDIITLEFQENKDSKIVIYNTLGEKIFSYDSLNKTKVTIDLSSYCSGTYFLKIIDSKSNYLLSKKIIKI